jgi:DNA-binding transcriptional ArsR family regulator
MKLAHRDAETWAACFSAMGDPTRLAILNLLATGGEPLSVAEIVELVDVGQSTVSYHLGILESVGFVVVERQGTTSLWRINDECLTCLPAAVDVVMGRGARGTPWERVRARRVGTLTRKVRSR